jgi:hypothetical protein
VIVGRYCRLRRCVVVLRLLFTVMRSRIAWVAICCSARSRARRCRGWWLAWRRSAGTTRGGGLRADGTAARGVGYESPDKMQWGEDLHPRRAGRSPRVIGAQIDAQKSTRLLRERHEPCAAKQGRSPMGPATSHRLERTTHRLLVRSLSQARAQSLAITRAAATYWLTSGGWKRGEINNTPGVM